MRKRKTSFFPLEPQGRSRQRKIQPCCHPPATLPFPRLSDKESAPTLLNCTVLYTTALPSPLSSFRRKRREERKKQTKTIPMSVAYSGIKREGEKGFCLPLGWFVSGVRTRCRSTHLRTFEKDISSRRGEMRHWRVLKQQEHHRCFLAFWP